MILLLERWNVAYEKVNYKTDYPTDAPTNLSVNNFKTIYVWSKIWHLVEAIPLYVEKL
jgi:hypothetical protein